MDDILEYIQLNKECPVLNPNETNYANVGSYESNNQSFNQIKLPEEELRKLYYNKVEDGNNIISEIETVERDYLKTKYGENIYNYLIDKRNKYINDNINISSSGSGGGSGGGSSGGGGSLDATLIQNLINDISNEVQLYYTLHVNDAYTDTVSFSNALRQMNTDMKNMENSISLNKRKMVYRNEVINSTNYLNNILSIIYFLVIICLFVFLYSSGKIQLFSHWYVFVIAILAPFLFRYLFYIIIYLSYWIDKKINYNGPTNAFVDEKNELEFIINKYEI